MFPIYASIALFGLYIFFKVSNSFYDQFFILFSLSVIRRLVSSERFGQFGFKHSIFQRWSDSTYAGLKVKLLAGYCT